MKEKVLIDLLKNALHLKDSEEIRVLQRLGGMTNINYLVAIGDEQFVVRIPGLGTKDFINRKTEKENLQLGTALGINPQLIYFDEQSGMKITKKIHNAETLTPFLAKSDKTMKKVATIFQTLHHANVQMMNRFRLFDMMDLYEGLARDEGAQLFADLKSIKQDIHGLKLAYESMGIKETPCHIDPSFTNFIKSGNDKIYLIDWEYSGMFDPLWDLAAYSLESGLSMNEEDRLLEYYFARKHTEQEAQRLLMHKIFQDYLWSLWTLYKEEKGDQFGEYGKNRFERAKRNIELYKETFDQARAG